MIPIGLENKQYISAPRNDPCGTPNVRHLFSDVLVPTVTHWILSLRQDRIQHKALSVSTKEYSKTLLKDFMIHDIEGSGQVK